MQTLIIYAIMHTNIRIMVTAHIPIATLNDALNRTMINSVTASIKSISIFKIISFAPLFLVGSLFFCILRKQASK